MHLGIGFREGVDERQHPLGKIVALVEVHTPCDGQ
jgi:hypothetical protein